MRLDTWTLYTYGGVFTERMSRALFFFFGMGVAWSAKNYMILMR